MCCFFYEYFIVAAGFLSDYVIQAGKREDAVKCFQKALSLMSSHPDARKNMEALT